MAVQIYNGQPITITSTDTTIRFFAVIPNAHYSQLKEETYLVSSLIKEFTLINEFSLNNEFAFVDKLSGRSIHEWLIKPSPDTPTINNILWTPIKPTQVPFDSEYYSEFDVLGSEFKFILDSENNIHLVPEYVNVGYEDVILSEVGNQIITEDNSNNDYIIKEGFDSVTALLFESGEYINTEDGFYMIEENI